ncbi:hypothetical protein IFM58399_04156 [Aspergillus lentulus]|uniref:Uncharacterized protein n=1 Tax=Aspergillus lentulus TaxID=293939 RepID=A0AAN5YK38_ASPLE|nr:uncharacterized protein IFM58399_04156 [Aspergillus lentulus]KAF4184921.1 hypothetical protein CNMCM7927_007433 [Aspergillus lentulus]KAF4201670.1 hypothetical protein CNMCM8927_001271 [Aspergillus lentulus]GFF35282.1 hypothetical protein IFM58399_04156 [Aspergillus lentulus]GFF72557.1 hypothetical protein IFM47457_03173 [Aspergillus lentulus]
MDRITSHRQFRPSHASQFALEEHLQENAPVTPSKSPNKTRLTESEDDNCSLFGEYSSSLDLSPVRELDGVRNDRNTNVKSTIPTVPFSRQLDTHFIFNETLPTNPTNSPASESEQAKHLSSAHLYRERNRKSALSSHQSNITSITCSSENIRARLLTNEDESNWRPPRPPKPPFLSDAAVEDFKLSGQAQQRASTISPERKHPTPSQHAILPQPSRWPQPHSRFVEYLPSEEKVASFVQRDTWIDSSPQKPHDQRRVAHRGVENAYRVLLGDPDKPFPAPIPTSDRLPLLRAILSPKSRIAFLRSLSTDYGASSSRPTEDTFLKHLAGLLSRPSRLVPHWQKLRSSSPITLTLYQPLHNSQCSSLVQVSYMVHVETVLSAYRKRAADSEQDVPSPNTSMDGYTRLFELRLSVPTLCFEIVRPFIVGMRHPVLVTIASMFVCVFAIVLRFLAGMGFRSLSSLHEHRPYLDEEDPESAALQK